jgi:hypothetical protein
MNTPSRTPTAIPFTKRQRITTHAGAVLELAYIVMPAEAWQGLQRLCEIHGSGGSKVIQQLISLASSNGKLKDTNETNSFSTS